MANIPEPVNPGFPPVYQWNISDDVEGGPDGTASRPIQQLVERTAHLNGRLTTNEALSNGNKNRIDSIEVSIDSVLGANKFNTTPFLRASNKRELTIVGGFFSENDIVLNVTSIMDTGALQNGKDYYLFECPMVGGQRVYKVSLSKTAPSGYDPEDVTLLGGFHTLCANVGSGLTYVEGGVTLNHPLNGYVASDILPASVWCLNHRPFSEPEGMVYIDTMDIWVDIYLQSGSGANTKSVYQGAITATRQYTDFVEDLFCVKKTLLNDEEFAAAMLGSNEETNVQGSSSSAAKDGGAGGRIDTAGRRMISKYGVEEGCGSHYQWIRQYGNTSSTTWNWTTQAGNKGQYLGPMAVVLAGGGWNNGANCGSRCRNANDSRSFSYSDIGGRGRSRTKR